MLADDLRRALQDIADAEPVDSAAALVALRRRARARLARRSVAGGAVVVALVVGAVVAVDPGDDDAPVGGVDVGSASTTADPPDPTPSTDPGPVEPTPVTTSSAVSPAGWAPVAGSWTELPPAPLSPRQFAAAAWTGEVVLVVGGNAPSCSSADCPAPDQPLVDGAVFDPASGAWRTIAPPPVREGWHVEGLVSVGATAYALAWPPDLASQPELIAYSVRDDRWSVVDPPDGGFPEYPDLFSAGDRLVVFDWVGTGDLTVLDPASGRWEQLPAVPEGLVGDPRLAAVDGTLVLVAASMEDSSGPSPSYRAAVLRPGAGAWDVVAGFVNTAAPAWFPVGGGRIVNPEVVDDGTQVESGWPHGGAFDLGTGSWEPLPQAPAVPVRPWAPSIGGERFLLSQRGLVFDTATWTWIPLPELPVRLGGGAAVTWAGDALVVWGGHLSSDTSSAGELVEGGWIWLPA